MSEVHQLVRQGRTLTYQLKYRKASRRARLRVVSGNVVLTVPNQRWHQLGRELLNNHWDWINAEVAKHTNLRTQQLADGSAISIFGEELTLAIKEGAHTDVVEHAGVITLTQGASDTQDTLQRLSKYLRRKYGVLLKHRCLELATQHKFQVSAISIRDQRSRWGSCSSDKAIALNWRLIFAPLTVIDYVILHELAHTVELNHSDNFWKIIANLMPNYKQAMAWLKANHSMLSAY